MVRRTKLDLIWETLDDPNSSSKAWWISQFLKLLRYFEITRLLIDACHKSAEAVPVLSYMMALIVLISATFIYLFEERSNIPSMPHSLWLAVVTMTTVGYGDFYPTSVGGYLTAALLTFVSVVFLALPVGIIGHEFNKSWQSRAHMLLMTRVRKCLNKWGFNAGDVQILIQYAESSPKKGGAATRKEGIPTIDH
eukprot:Skav220921  [mRNA]  locus=scaffold1145:262907:267636:+ [translate_table: standard]